MSTPPVKKLVMTDCFNPSEKTRRSNGLQAKRPRIVPEEQLEYDSIPICGVFVQLPQGLKPYPTQKLMMMRMLQSLDKQLNALLESPTGSGKTMALLASSCAWLVKYKEEAAKSKEECRVHGYSASAQSLNDTAKTNSAFNSTVHRSSDFPETSKSVKEKVETLKHTKPGPFYLIDEMEELNEDFYQPYTSFVPAAHPNDDVYTEDGHAKVEGCTCKPKIRVYYGTRTHRQIAHVVKEYGRLPFGVKGTLRHTILASREQSCINEEVRNSGDMTSNCREKLKEKDGPSGCEFKQNINRAGCGKGPYMRSFVNQECGSQVWDMEDLVDALKHAGSMCPYFASNRIMTMDADIIFCPYNYLIDPIIRSSSDVHLSSSIVILDEAHNIEDTCREAATFSFSEEEAYVASKDLLVKAKRFWEQARPNEMYSSDGDDVVVLDENSSTGDQPDVGDANARDISLNLRQLADFAQRMYAWVMELSHATKKRNTRDDRTTYTQVMSGAELHATLHKAKIFLPEDSPAFKSLLSAFTKTAGMVDDKMGSFPKEKSLCKPSSTTLVTLQKFLYFSKFFGRTREFYKCNVELMPPGHASLGRPSAISRGGAGPTQTFLGEQRKDARAAVAKFEPAVSGYEAFVNLWCMMPSVVCEDALKDCRSVILASGTLCPSETFKTELGIEFKLHMEGDQVISKDRIFATVIAKGPTGHSLCAVYRNLAPQSPLLCELAQILLDVCQTVPKGVLCFVSSYKILELLMQTLQTRNYKQHIEQKKVVIEEPRRSSDLAATMEKFDDAIESPQKYGVDCDGALMIAVYRGKLSEGIDFTDDKARCVVCVGIPFPNTKDGLVMEKRKFNDENPIHGLISGERWYSTQAYRALNQALGRCLRHKNDWGALLLVDERFVANARSNEPQSESQKISKWVRENLRIHRGYREFKADLDRFVQMRLYADRGTADVKAVKPFKAMPILGEEERIPSSFSDEVIVLDDEPAAAQKYQVELNEEVIVLEDDDEVIVLDDSD